MPEFHDSDRLPCPTVRIEFEKLSAERHKLTVARNDRSIESVELESRSMLRHDLAHLVMESQMPLPRGFWGHVAQGAPLTGEGIEGQEAELAEALAGPAQTLMRDGADSEQYRELLERLAPHYAGDDLARRIYAHARQLLGHWRATHYGESMQLSWGEVSDE